MKIILLKDVGGVGQKGAIRDVSSGYALNFLIPHGLAEQATGEKITAHEAAQKKELEEKERAAELREATVKSAEGSTVEISVRATEKGGLFKAITEKDIARALSGKGKEITSEEIVLEKPIKTTGEHPIEIRAGDARARITILVRAV